MNKHNITFCLIVSIWLAGTGVRLVAQTKTQAESALQRLTPEEIDRKLKELGISKEEAINRASALNINLEDYLRNMQTVPGETPTPGVTDTTRVAPPVSVARGEVTIQKKDTLPVPGFEGRIPLILRPFGYNIFQYSASTFQPVVNVATPPSYVLGPGDEVTISMWGETKLNFQIPVNREGSIVIPDVGPIHASGMTIQQLRDKMLRRMSAVYSSLHNGESGATSFLDVSLGKLRTLQIFVLGEAQKPGGYSLSSLSTALHALYLSGGPTMNGSLRNIQIVRGGKIFETLDFYDYALRPDKSKDIRLQDGDIVFIKPAGKRVALVGFVVRPAIYELSESEKFGDVIGFAGGLRFNAYIDRTHIERMIPFNERKEYTHNFLDFDLRFTSHQELETSKFEMQDGDVVTVFKVDTIPENRVTITGSVKKPGIFELKPGMRIKDLIMEADSLDRNTFSEQGMLFRLLPNLRHEVISFNPRLALVNDIHNNVELKNEDSVALYKESLFFPEHSVSVGGSVRSQGQYPRRDSMTIADLIVMAGGLTEGASSQGWELARLDTSVIGALSLVKQFNVSENYWEDDFCKHFVLHDFDHLMIPSNPKYNTQRVVGIWGYVLYPGAYALQNEGEKLSSIIRRAGGLRPGAYLEGSSLFRKWKNAGLVSIDFVKALADTQSLDNITVLHEDSINISPLQDLIYIRGEVFMPAAVAHKQGASLSYYLGQAGGLKETGDEDRVYVTLPNGKKWEQGWFILPSPEIPGGTIISVPRKIEREDKTLSIVTSWATIMASLATMMIAIVQVTK
ncbi:MAG: SLBB domain-containing protein [Ignavibacteriales bacterium]|nr:SLBB domain-containing protein [Ignavibacteriales bacterium]